MLDVHLPRVRDKVRGNKDSGSLFSFLQRVVKVLWVQLVMGSAFRMSCTDRYKSFALGYRTRYTKDWYCNMIRGK